MGETARLLAGLLTGGPVRMGQLVLWGAEGQSWGACHGEDATVSAESLEAFTEPGQAREIAKYAPDGAYRALKAGKDLRRGWILRLATAEDLAMAVELIYPAALGQWLAKGKGELRVVPLRETLGRQTGMYRYAHRISGEGVARIVAARCRTQCLRRILWPEGTAGAASSGGGAAGPREIPLVCSEACALLVADARLVAKEEADRAAGGGD